jgi:hypothetical protein
MRIPSATRTDVDLIATEAMLAARDTVHPAIVNLLLETIRDEHDDQGNFETPGEFPNFEQVDLPVSLDAVRHKRFGPSVLYRYLPFWVATFVERFIIIVLPLFVVVVPVVQRPPQVLNWRARSRIYRWYGELSLLERGSGPNRTGGRADQDTGQLRERVLHAARAHQPGAQDGADKGRRFVPRTNHCGRLTSGW